MKTYKRALSNAQAASCENAKHPQCRCRCGGALHGSGHASYQAQEREILDRQKELSSKQITELISLANPAKQVIHAKQDNHSEPTIGEVMQKAVDREGWVPGEVDDQKPVHGRLPLEVA